MLLNYYIPVWPRIILYYILNFNSIYDTSIYWSWISSLWSLLMFFSSFETRERREREREQTKTLHQFHPMKSFPLGSSTFERNEGIYKASEKPRNFHLSHLIRYRSQCETKICLFFSVATVTLRKHQNGK